MAWTTPDSPSAGDVLSAANYRTYIRDNLNYLHSGRPYFSIRRDNNANYATSSTSFVDIDGTNLAATLTLTGSAALVGFSAVVGVAATNAQVDFDITVDGTRFGAAGADGLFAAPAQVGYDTAAHFVALITGLTPGAHTFKVQWKSPGGNTVQLAAGNGSAGQDYIAHFWGIEVA